MSLEPRNLIRLMESAVGNEYFGGTIVFVSTAVLLYVFHCYVRTRVASTIAQRRERTRELRQDIVSQNRDRMVARMELDILRAVISQGEIDTVLDLILRRYVPNSQSGFAAFLRPDDEVDRVSTVFRCRGLSDVSIAQLQLNDTTLKRVADGQVIAIERETEIEALPFLSHLSPIDRRKAVCLYLAAIEDDNGLQGVFMSTAVYPPFSVREAALDFMLQLMQCLAATFEKAQLIQQSESELQTSKERLALRSIIDTSKCSVPEVARQFCERLMQMLKADRITLYLSNEPECPPSAPLLRCGSADDAGFGADWRACELELRQRFDGRRILKIYGKAELEGSPFDGKVGSAIVAKMGNREDSLGWVCLFRRFGSEFSPADKSLAAWAFQYFSDALLRMLLVAQLEDEASHDGLTGLVNRRVFNETLNREMKRAGIEKKPASLLLFDLDHFKAVNDNYGHQAGDLVLKRTSQLLKASIESAQHGSTRTIAARYGGEELALFLHDTNCEQAELLADQIRAQIENAVIEADGTAISVTSSIGVAAFPLHAEEADGLVAAADAALYRAKQTGRNRVVVAESLLQPLNR